VNHTPGASLKEDLGHLGAGLASVQQPAGTKRHHCSRCRALAAGSLVASPLRTSSDSVGSRADAQRLPMHERRDRPSPHRQRRFRKRPAAAARERRRRRPLSSAGRRRAHDRVGDMGAVRQRRCGRSQRHASDRPGPDPLSRPDAPLPTAPQRSPYARKAGRHAPAFARVQAQESRSEALLLRTIGRSPTRRVARARFRSRLRSSSSRPDGALAVVPWERPCERVTGGSRSGLAERGLLVHDRCATDPSNPPS
jgi:hypothetical protein